MTNQKSEIVLRSAVVAAALILAFAIGHFGLAPLVVSGGRALRNVPAPPQSRLAGALDAAPEAGRAMLRYVSRESAGSVAEFYRNEMPARGWTPRALPTMMEESAGAVMAFADTTGTWCIISVTEAGAGGGSAVTLTRLASVPIRGPAEAAPKEEMP